MATASKPAGFEPVGFEPVIDHTAAMRADSPLFRRIIGAAAVACLVAAVGLTIVGTESEVWRGGAVRGGLALGALWLALPATGRPAAWEGIRPLTAFIAAAAVLLALVRPKVGLPLCGVLLLIRYVSRPFRRTSRRSRRP